MLAQDSPSVVDDVWHRGRGRRVPAVHRPQGGRDASSSSTSSRIKLGAQNVLWEYEGAFTGEVSPRMLKELRAHAERVPGHVLLRRVEADMLAPRHHGRATRTAVDARRRDGREEPAVEARVTTAHRLVAGVGIQGRHTWTLPVKRPPPSGKRSSTPAISSRRAQAETAALLDGRNPPEEGVDTGHPRHVDRGGSDA